MADSSRCCGDLRPEHRKKLGRTRGVAGAGSYSVDADARTAQRRSHRWAGRYVERTGGVCGGLWTLWSCGLVSFVALWEIGGTDPLGRE